LSREPAAEAASAVAPGERRAAVPRWRRIARIVGGGIVVAALLYGLLLVFPAPLFRHRLQYRQFRVYSTQPLDPIRVTAVLDRAESLLVRSPLHDPERIHRLYCTASFRHFAFFARRSHRAFAINNAVIRNIFLSRSQWESDAVYANRPNYNRRSLSAVLAHEMIHTLMEKRYGVLATLRVPTWKREGYADYVAQESSFDLARGREMIRQGSDDVSPAFLYLKSRLVVAHLLEDEGMSVDEFLTREFDAGALESELRERLARGASPPE
jgi:hypothetical protein